jgi:hypothetical protein
MFILLIAIIPALFYSDNSEFFKRANQEIHDGAEWHYVGKQSLDPSSLSISIRYCDIENGISTNCRKPYILYKLKHDGN